MRERHRSDPESPTPQTAHAPGGDNDETVALRDEANLLLAAADDAITRALSRNSERFLSQNRQQGGQ